MRQFVKSPLASRTLWLNGISTVIAMATIIAAQEWVSFYPRVAAGLAGIVFVGNYVLRYFTTTEIK